MRTPALFQLLSITCPVVGLQTVCRYQTPNASVPRSGTLCSSTRSAGSCGSWFAPLAQPLSTSWSTLWQPRGTPSALLSRERVPRYQFPMYGMVRGCKSTWALLVAPCASLRVADTACTVVRTSFSLPLRLANNIPHEWPFMLWIVHRCDSHISLRGALPLFVHIGLRLHIPRLGGWTHVWTPFHRWECTWHNFSLFFWPLWAPIGVSYQPGSACRASSRFRLPQPGKPALIPPPGLDICLP